ncbi:hypothetical protein CHS0354_006526 [Potamilus streckersoni]|uniref:Homeobox domain-containing protein n=1 Tax=Potamilus streckersoni TaxID=2493646 RepID=A0AAE0WAB8_9BIVA|nr:hypothetical protein CHS0354_006526 [Potamilus streckersoni]
MIGLLEMLKNCCDRLTSETKEQTILQDKRESLNDTIKQSKYNCSRVEYTNFSIEEILKPAFGSNKPIPLEEPCSSNLESYSASDTGCLSDVDGFLEQEQALDLSLKRQQASELPAWIFCTRYSARPSAGPRNRKKRRVPVGGIKKRGRVAFKHNQLHRLEKEFEISQYLSETRRRDLARELTLQESQVKVWFQNRRAKVKKSNELDSLALQLCEHGLYGHGSKKNHFDVIRSEVYTSDSERSCDSLF